VNEDAVTRPDETRSPEPAPQQERRGRRWPWVVGAVVVSICLSAALVWFVWLPEYRPALQPGEQYGIDVSHHQGDIDWDQVAADDIRFAYIKATEGDDLTDRRFAVNWDRAAAAGIERGAYHFFTLCTPGRAQARHFLDVVPDDPDALPPAVDLEIAGNCSDRPRNDVVQRELGEFVDLVEATTGQDMTVYLGADFDSHYPVRQTLERPIWHRRFLLRPDVADWAIWQVTGFAHVEGIAGDVDLDVMRPDFPS
jgi:lysozyme